MRQLGIISYFVLSLCIITNTAYALEVPALSSRVTDHAGMLNPNARTTLESKLRSYENETSNQIAVLTIPTLEGRSIEGFSIEVATKWKLGQKGKDNGALLLVVRDDRKLRIEVGYGLEATLTDIYSSRIIRNIMVPKLRAGDPSGAIESGVDAILGVLGGAATTPVELTQPSSSNSPSNEELTWWDLLGFIIMIGFFIIRGMFGGGRGARVYRAGGFYSGGSSSSTFSGGGGSFGGGGSSGSW